MLTTVLFSSLLGSMTETDRMKFGRRMGWDDGIRDRQKTGSTG